MTTEKPLNRMNNKYGLLHLILFFKGTVSVILSDPPGKDGYAQVTTVPLKLLSEQKCGGYCCFSRFRSV